VLIDIDRWTVAMEVGTR